MTCMHLKKNLVSTEDVANDIINHAMQSTAIHVGELLLEQECVLLPTVKQVFVSTVTEENVTSRWLLSNLAVHLQHHLTRFGSNCTGVMAIFFYTSYIRQPIRVGVRRRWGHAQSH